MSETVGVTIRDNPEKHRYEAVDGSGTVAGFSLYIRRDDHIVFTHTEVDPKFEGHGVGSQLARGALDDVRQTRLVVVAQCPFVKAFIEEHPDYQDLLA